MISRRLILKLLGTAGVFISGRGSNAMAQLFYRPERKESPRISTNLFRKDGKSLIGISGVDEEKGVYGTVKEAVSIIGGFQKLEIKGKTVLVKPNIVSGEPNPATTNPEVVKAVIRLLYEEGARKVYSGDMSALMTLSTSRNMKKNGMEKAIMDAGGEIVVFEEHDWVEVELPGASYINKAYVTEWIYNVDLVVNLPVIKTHRSASYSIALKNFIGCTHLKQRPYLVDSSHWEELIAEFNLAYSPVINIVDGTVSMIEGGPWEGTPARTNLIMASGDRVAADIAGLGIIKSFRRWKKVASMDVWDQRQIKRALELRLGAGKEEIRMIVGTGDKAFKSLTDSARDIAGLS